MRPSAAWRLSTTVGVNPWRRASVSSQSTPPGCLVARIDRCFGEHGARAFVLPGRKYALVERPARLIALLADTPTAAPPKAPTGPLPEAPTAAPASAPARSLRLDECDHPLALDIGRLDLVRGWVVSGIGSQVWVLSASASSFIAMMACADVQGVPGIGNAKTRDPKSSSRSVLKP